MKYTHNKYLEVDHCNSINVSYILCVNWTELQSIYQDHHDHMLHDILVSITLPPLRSCVRLPTGAGWISPVRVTAPAAAADRWSSRRVLGETRTEYSSTQTTYIMTYR